MSRLVTLLGSDLPDRHPITSVLVSCRNLKTEAEFNSESGNVTFRMLDKFAHFCVLNNVRVEQRPSGGFSEWWQMPGLFGLDVASSTHSAGPRTSMWKSQSFDSKRVASEATSVHHRRTDVRLFVEELDAMPADISSRGIFIRRTKGGRVDIRGKFFILVANLQPEL